MKLSRFSGTDEEWSDWCLIWLVQDIQMAAAPVNAAPLLNQELGSLASLGDVVRWKGAGAS